MPEITREWLEEKRRFLNTERVRLQGALDMLDALEDELFPQAEPAPITPVKGGE